jgi:hypothetical protein
MPAKVVIRRKFPKYISDDKLEKIESILKNNLPAGWTFKRNHAPIFGRYWSWTRDGWLLKRPGDGAAVGTLRMDTRQILVLGPRYIDDLKELANLIAVEIDDTVLLTLV